MYWIGEGGSECVVRYLEAGGQVRLLTLRHLDSLGPQVVVTEASVITLLLLRLESPPATGQSPQNE